MKPEPIKVNTDQSIKTGFKFKSQRFSTNGGGYLKES